MADTVTIATITLPDLGVKIEYKNDNSISLEEGWLFNKTISAQDAEQLYAFIKAQRTKAGLPL